MHVEFTSLIDRWTHDASARRVAQSRARLLERHNFDRLLIDDSEGLPDNNELGSFILHNTNSLSIAIPHRVGLVPPLAAAQQFATLDQLSAGRLAIRITNPTGGRAAPSDHEAELARIDEYLVLLKRLWANTQPFDHEGRFYSIDKGAVSSRPFGRAGIPFILGGFSGTAIKVAARHADVFALPFSSLDSARQTIERVQAAAVTVGRHGKIRFSMDVFPDTSGPGADRRLAAELLRFRELGISEFVIRGLDTPGEIAHFGDSVVPSVRFESRSDAGDLMTGNVDLERPRPRQS